MWSGGVQRLGVAHRLTTRPAGFAPVRRARPQIHSTGRSGGASPRARRIASTARLSKFTPSRPTAVASSEPFRALETHRPCRASGNPSDIRRSRHRRLTPPGPGIGRRHAPPPASDRRTPSAGVRGCTTRFSNTHSTVERKILYEFHPWFGQEVAIDRAFTRSGVSVARCRQPGRGPSPLLEVPLWMFDRQSCSIVRRRERPYVDLTTLEALADLLSVVVGADAGSSNFPPTDADRHADLRSHERSQGADDACIPPEVCPVGSVRSFARQPSSRHAAMGQSAGSAAATGDAPDDPDAVGTSRQPSRGGEGRDRRGDK